MSNLTTIALSVGSGSADIGALSFVLVFGQNEFNVVIQLSFMKWVSKSFQRKALYEGRDQELEKRIYTFCFSLVSVKYFHLII